MIWIQPRHLTDETLEEYRRAFEAHPVRVLVMRHVLQPSLADAVSRFLEQEVEFRRVFGLHSRHETYTDVTEEQWRNADESDRFFTYRLFDGVRSEHRLSGNLFAYLKLYDALVDRQFTTLIESFTGVPLGDSEFHVHAMKAGDFLKPHRDGRPERRLAGVLFLSRDWRADYGGALHFVNPVGEGRTVEPEYNSLALFDVTACIEHYVAPIADAAGERMRLTMSGWFHHASTGA